MVIPAAVVMPSMVTQARRSGVKPDWRGNCRNRASGNGSVASVPVSAISVVRPVLAVIHTCHRLLSTAGNEVTSPTAIASGGHFASGPFSAVSTLRFSHCIRLSAFSR